MRMRKKASASSGIQPQRGSHGDEITLDLLIQSLGITKVCGCEEEHPNLSTGTERALLFNKIASYVKMCGLGGGYALRSPTLSLDDLRDLLSKVDKQMWSDIVSMMDQNLNERIIHRVCRTIRPECRRFSEDKIMQDCNEHSVLNSHSKSSTRNRDLQLPCDYGDQEEAAGILITHDHTKQKISSELAFCQPTIVIGLVGHMKHGKTTVKDGLCGLKVATGATEEIGFDNAKIYKCEDECCSFSTRYIMHGCKDRDSSFQGHEKCKMKLLRHISFIDCPGNPNFLPTTLCAIGIMDAAVLVISADESCGQPQTTEHLIALEIKCNNNIIIIQSKIDSVSTREKLDHLKEIKAYVKDTIAKDAVILEKGKSYVDMVCKTIVEDIHNPPRNSGKPPVMIIIKSDDDNSVHRSSNEKRRLVVFGVLLEGMLTPAQDVLIMPGIVFHEGGTIKHRPLTVQTDSVYAEETQLRFALPGGIIKLYLTTDCTEPISSLAGHYLGEKGKLPKVFTAFRVSYSLLQCFLGLRKGVAKELRRNENYLVKEEILLVTIGGLSTGARVLSSSKKKAELLLTFPVCARKGETVTLCRRVGVPWRLAGKACLISGVTGQRSRSSRKI